MSTAKDTVTTAFRRPAVSGFIDKVRGFRQHYLDWPGTEPPVVLLHPKRSNARHWDHIVDAMARRNRVLAPDARGHGLSDYPKDGYRVPELGADVVAFLDAVGVSRAFFVGGATGGNLCIWLAANHPDRVAGIAVVDPGMSVPKHIAAEVIRQTKEEHNFPDFETAKASMHFQELWRPEVRDHYAAHSFSERDDGRWGVALRCLTGAPNRSFAGRGLRVGYGGGGRVPGRVGARRDVGGVHRSPHGTPGGSNSPGPRGSPQGRRAHARPRESRGHGCGGR